MVAHQIKIVNEPEYKDTNRTQIGHKPDTFQKTASDQALTSKLTVFGKIN
jgi:hypothetical protein